MKLGPAIVAGIVAGVIGAAIWAAISYFANMEIGWIAWGIGGLVGVAMAAAGQHTSPQLGVAAVVITILAIVGGKYAAIQIAIRNALPADSEWTAAFENEQYLISLLADDEVARRQQAGEAVNWPAGVDPDNAAKPADYPPGIWTVADDSWSKMSADERTRFKTDRIAQDRASMQTVLDAIASKAFKESFGAMDLLFFGLAVVTAFQIAGRPQGKS